MSAEDESVTAFLRRDDWPPGSDPDRTRHVFLSWLGAQGALPTLEELGDEFGVTRERVRQIKNAALERSLEVRDWVEDIEGSLQRARRNRQRPLTVAGLSTLVPSIGALAELPTFWRRYTRDLSSNLHLVSTSLGVAISWRSESAVEDAVLLVADGLENLTEPRVPERRLAVLVQAACLANGIPDFQSEVSARVKRGLVAIPPGSHDSDLGREGAVLGIELSQHETVRRILAASDSPLSVDTARDLVEIARGIRPSKEAVRRGLAADGYPFGRSLYGLPRHLPLDASDRAELADACESIVEDWRDSQEQWHASDLVLLLGEMDGIPRVDHLDHYTLSVVLHSDSDLFYKGRSVWTHPDDASSRREIAQMVEAVLVDAGEPLPRNEIRRRISKTRGLSTQSMLHEKGDVARVGRGRWGLMSRDFYLVRQGLGEKVIAALVTALDASGEGIHPDEIDADLIGLPPEAPIEQVRHEVVAFARRSETLWVSYGGMLGLAKWEEMGRPSIREALIEVAARLTAPAPISSILSEVRELVGRDIQSNRLHAHMAEAGLAYDPVTEMWGRAD